MALKHKRSLSPAEIAKWQEEPEEQGIAALRELRELSYESQKELAARFSLDESDEATSSRLRNEVPKEAGKSISRGGFCGDRPHTQDRGGAAFALRLSLSFLILLSSGAIIAADPGLADFRQGELPPAMLSYVLK